MVRRRRGAGSAALVAGLVLVGLATGSVRAAQPVYTGDNAPATPKLDELPLQQNVSQYGITWTFDKPVRVGQFVNGDYYVVGPVTVVGLDPKPLYGEDVKDVTDSCHPAGRSAPRTVFAGE